MRGRAGNLARAAREWLELAAADPERAAAFLEWLGGFRNRYRALNRVLVYLQDPAATAVAGRGRWARWGRRVAPGARGVWILAPAEGGGLEAVRVYDVRFTRPRGPLLPERRVEDLARAVRAVRAACPHPLPERPAGGRRVRAWWTPGQELAACLNAWMRAEARGAGAAGVAAYLVARWLGVAARLEARALRGWWSDGEAFREALEEALELGERVYLQVREALEAPEAAAEQA